MIDMATSIFWKIVRYSRTCILWQRWWWRSLEKGMGRGNWQLPESWFLFRERISRIRRTRRRKTVVWKYTQNQTLDWDWDKYMEWILIDIPLILLLYPHYHCCLFWKRSGRGYRPIRDSGRMGVVTHRETRGGLDWGTWSNKVNIKERRRVGSNGEYGGIRNLWQCLNPKRTAMVGSKQWLYTRILKSSGLQRNRPFPGISDLVLAVV